ncbi:MAG: hypothetical protein J0M24_00320 [Verrucomicrobia bacterium]|nr:hypothetical protein [Verrucomicrobiota bacterium]
MKTKSKWYLVAVSAAALALNVSTSSGQIFSPADASNNRAVAASPRARETFPWLTRTAVPRTKACCASSTLEEVKKNRAFAASPRMLEQFPELSRQARTQPEFTIAPLVEKNAAVVSSPRYRENHPEVSRGTTTGTAKGGASKLMELGK